MSTKNLLNTLKAQEQNLDVLIHTLEEQKNAVVHNNYTALEKAIAEEQKIISNIEKEEEERIKQVKEIVEMYSLQLKGNSIEDLIVAGKKFFTEDIKQLKMLRLSLKKKLLHISSINSQLRSVTDFSRSMIKETMVMLAGTKKHIFVNKRV